MRGTVLYRASSSDSFPQRNKWPLVDIPFHKCGISLNYWVETHTVIFIFDYHYLITKEFFDILEHKFVAILGE